MFDFDKMGDAFEALSKLDGALSDIRHELRVTNVLNANFMANVDTALSGSEWLRWAHDKVKTEENASAQGTSETPLR